MDVGRRLRLLDLYCGAGGCGMGYHMAGFDVVGVDKHPQPRYPFPFVRGDALEYVALHGHEYDVIHASPPCQAYSRIENVVRGKFRERSPLRVDLVAQTRATLTATGKPYVIENVPGAPLIDPMMLCGLMFGLRVIRHRLFESNVFMLAPSHRSHTGVYTNAFAGVSGFRHGATHICVTGNNFIVEDARVAMGIDWMLARELTQAIPPAYTRWIGEQLLAYFGSVRPDPSPEGEGVRVWM